MASSGATDRQPGPGGYIYRGFSMSTVLAVSAPIAVILYFIPFVGGDIGFGMSALIAISGTCFASFLVEHRRKKEAGDFDTEDG